jgi:hypothetical protein
MQSAVCCARTCAERSSAGVNVSQAQMRFHSLFQFCVAVPPALSLKDNSTAPGQHKYSLSSNLRSPHRLGPRKPHGAHTLYRAALYRAALYRAALY